VLEEVSSQAMSNLVFHDPSGRRAKRADFALACALALLFTVFAAFAATLALAPRIPSVALRDPHVTTAVYKHALIRRGRPSWSRIPRPVARGAGERPLTVAFYVSWDPISRESLRQHVNAVDVVSPQWLSLRNANGDLDVTSDPQADALIRGARRVPAVMPVVHNARDQVWNGTAADALLANPRARAALIAKLADLAVKRGYMGYVFDFENMSHAGLAAYPRFVAEAYARMKSIGREIWVTAPIDDAAWPLKRLQAAASTLVLMNYDEHWSTGDPGPAAGQDWLEQNLSRSLPRLDPNKLIFAFGAYGYDWGPSGKADAVTFHEATLAALDSGVSIGFDPASLNPNFQYSDDDGRVHTVWFLDAVTTFNQLKVTDPWRPRGYALWRLGAEDPGIWSLLGRPYGAASTAALTRLAPSEDVDFDGDGEILHVEAQPTAGQRTLRTDAQTGLISNETYDVVPTAYVVQRLGQRPGDVALTFDDGPDPRWTPKILDILRQKHAPATFFVIGENMEDSPGLVEREVREGHLVGSHTYTHPNVAELSNAQVSLELNLTQRLFEVITGRTLRFFRPPYLGDADPSTLREVRVVELAQKLGYVTVGLRNDPDDWKKPDAALIVQRTLARLADQRAQTSAQVVLLHDSGGDRRRTIEALPNLIDALRAHGYRLVTVADLAGLTPQQAMPPAAEEPGQLLLDRIAFGIVRGFNKFIAGIFAVAIILGLARLVFLVALALVHRARFDRQARGAQDAEAPVSVLIPCFNEQAVIVASIERILASRCKRFEVLVLDDGSTDETAARVHQRFSDDPRVRLLRFPNGGKARALNQGLSAARGEIIVAMDADTQFAPDTIALLARWFADPAIGAVAGNALVGNRVNMLTRWQSLEYVTAQNLERRALAALGAVTVVPGAVGAWRRAALEQLGGFPHDTLAEDQDLTLAVQQRGWRVAFDPDARAYTEAPETLRALLRQRFRWSFGTLQCVWKHRDALFSRRRPVLGFVALPQIWLFQIFLALAAPLVDLVVVASLIGAVLGKLAHPTQWDAWSLDRTLLYWAVFVLVDLTACAIGLALERHPPWRDLIWLPVQRFGYRQIMYYVVVKAVLAAIRGPHVGWNKLERTARVRMAQRPPRVREAA
jgi:cellulose synthase/poly-beta-1,6-N-acetylglucosamine synthase-like glycosyltransferase/peptidoglycan/xylan/chitin deacetylase (PgdA/CDA1 family)/spore germination protein YaaH